METAQAVLAFIQEATGTQDLPLTPATSFEEDLGVTGDDAVRLLQDLAARYHVDLAHLRWDKYFHPEPSLGVRYRAVAPFTVGDILRAVEHGGFGPAHS
ncbi:DUF1493 family protein [Hymenobacter arizonensis]|uniref:Acyl carrier protein n=1 Tax=Hymenobacter arizonensis TaxID=1227077 RepID=A0A1I6BDQ8_HYMAR|nr:DUF1493 family protein [Hymenobacter arizonensis]SFQ79095.1 Acyl carrier protein [Hymenobacter arizonensis]